MTNSSTASVPFMLEGSVWLAFFTSNFAVLLLGLLNLKSLQIGMNGLALTLWFWLFLTHLAGTVVLGAVIYLISSLNWRGISRYGFGVAGLGYFVLVTGLNFRRLIDLPVSSVSLPLSVLGLPWGLVVVGGLVLLLRWPDRRWYVRLTGLVGFGLMAFSLVPYATAESTVRTVDRAGVREQPVYVLGLDGADWRYINPLIKAGELPNLARLKRRSARGALRTIKPTKSPAIWTSIATGEPPSEHGITQFVGNRIRGSSANFSRLNPVSGIGLKVLLPRILKLGSPLHSGNRQEATYWDIASAHGQPSIVVNWWMTWPATPMKGWLVTERVHTRSFGSLKRTEDQRRVIYPPSLRDRIDALTTAPDDVTYEDVRKFMDVSRQTFRDMQSTSWKRHQLRSEFKYMYSMFETNRTVTTDLLSRAKDKFDRSPDLFVTFRLLDMAGHTALRYSNLTPSHPMIDEEDEKRYGRVVTRAYREIDAAVGEILDGRDDGYVLVISDHGFEYNPDAEDPAKLFDHDRAPPGIWMLSGPGVRPGSFKGLSVYSVLPLVAYLKGLPIARDWKRTVPYELFDEGFVRNNETVSIENYDDSYLRDPDVDRTGWSEKDFKNRLKALGYLE